ncbi:MAG: hypothetical protein PHE17_14275 [Thiothrix sp.]|uniref:DUF3226 domain-containing protein n=1 Tax=Thiothrix sp. TaxID=1032 RepID=UPI0026147047|nr:DUF3226 domain-containing protein [Thiothrix sp.]MDD5394175.1 hypothetical protein [Thiothrix sp.]
MKKQQRILLVEGQDDRAFFQHFLCKLELQVDIEPETPQNFCQTESDGVDVLRTQALPTAWERITAGEVTHLAIIIDADSQKQGYGFAKRREQITNVLRDYGYNIPPFSDVTLTGEIFRHPEEFTPIGLWIMPTHSTDGMLEDLLLENLGNPTQQSLLDKADEAITGLGDLRTFKDTHISKARLSTLLAWQKKPGTSAGKAYQAGVFATDSAALTAFTQWLEAVFK